MDSYAKEFIKDYKIANDREYQIFLAKQNIYDCIKEGFPEVSLVDVQDDIKSMEKSFELDKKKLASYQLSPTQAISIISESIKTDNHTFDVNAIDGKDTYRFMNKAIQSNPNVAFAAWSADKTNERFIPNTLRERMEGHKPTQVFENMKHGATIDKSVEILNTVRDMTSRLTSRSMQSKSNILTLA